MGFYEILHFLGFQYHPVGTCSMGRGINDPNAVLDSKLRVLNTIGLRVADASIMPEIINGSCFTYYTYSANELLINLLNFFNQEIQTGHP